MLVLTADKADVEGLAAAPAKKAAPAKAKPPKAVNVSGAHRYVACCLASIRLYTMRSHMLT